ncbi:DUF423 domain-containing protein [Alkanindiges sp. WGS2144]|uniref:DUF423 domain-containing protein n=1 Tax=Alkanindiges sp. WGS2144 TaxID=3366808 RepID=UPI003753C577
MWLAIAAINLALAVCLGAFGAHGLKSRATAEQLVWWHTATEYFFYHALGLLAVGILIKLLPSVSFKLPASLLQLGIIIFCGSLYLMALGAPRWFGAITPLGGLAMIMGWLSLAVLIFRANI